VTLVRLAMGYLAVAVLFVGAGWVTGLRGRRTVAVVSAEALALTLLGALWFASIGPGGWVLVFTFIGLLASGTDRWIAAVGKGEPLGPPVRITLLVTIRYIVAGGLLFLIIG
jgi:hypothetical protein